MRRGIPARPGSIRTIATRSPKINTRTSATQATQMLVQKAWITCENDVLIGASAKNVFATPPSLASRKIISAATMSPAAAYPIEMSASSRPRAAILRAGTSWSSPSSDARSRAAAKARAAGTQAYRVRTTTTTPTVVETQPAWWKSGSIIAAFTINAVTATDSASATVASPKTGRGGLGVGLGCSSSLTRLTVLISWELLDRPDRHRGRVATEGRPEVGTRQGVESAVVDHRLDALV